jgi:hypothetical protein
MSKQTKIQTSNWLITITLYNTVDESGKVEFLHQPNSYLGNVKGQPHYHRGSSRVGLSLKKLLELLDLKAGQNILID